MNLLHKAVEMRAPLRHRIYRVEEKIHKIGLPPSYPTPQVEPLARCLIRSPERTLNLIPQATALKSSLLQLVQESLQFTYDSNLLGIFADLS